MGHHRGYGAIFTSDDLTRYSCNSRIPGIAFYNTYHQDFQTLENYKSKTTDSYSPMCLLALQ